MFQVLGLNPSLLKPVSVFLLNSIELERHPAICIVFKSVPDQLSDCGPHRFSFFFFSSSLWANRANLNTHVALQGAEHLKQSACAFGFCG